MKVLYPVYFKNFKCIADKCEDTCCAGWDIVVDEKSESFYKGVNEPIGEKLRKTMIVDTDGDTVFPLENNRCPFLNSSNLCDIYSELGENALCHTCKKFPRFIEEFGSSREIGLGLACPEAARIIVNFESKNELIFEMNDDMPMLNDIDPEYYFFLLNLRKNIFEVLNSDDISLENKLLKILALAGDNEPEIPSVERCKAHLKKLDFLTCRWEALLTENVSESNFSAKEKQLSNIAWYYVYRYLLKAVYDNEFLNKIRLCILAVVVINAYSNNENIADIAHLFSKEVEYSKENISSLLRGLYENF